MWNRKQLFDLWNITERLCFMQHLHSRTTCFHVITFIFNFWILCPSTSSTYLQLSNGFDHHAAVCLHGVVLEAQDTHLHPPSFTYSSSTTSPISSPSYSSISSTWLWSQSGSGQSGEFLPLSPSGQGMIPSSRVPSWKVWCSLSLIPPHPFFFLFCLHRPTPPHLNGFFFKCPLSFFLYYFNLLIRKNISFTFHQTFRSII